MCDHFIEALATRCELGSTLVFSLINVVFSYDPVGCGPHPVPPFPGPQSDPYTRWGIPYGHALVPDPPETVTTSPCSYHLTRACP
jgi:hypothetical protein